MGDGTTEDRYVPTLVLGITQGTQQISEGGGGGCALTSGSGSNVGAGFDGNDFVEQQSADAVAALPGGVAEASAGAIDGCAVASTSGSLQCWGGMNGASWATGPPIRRQHRSAYRDSRQEWDMYPRG